MQTDSQLHKLFNFQSSSETLTLLDAPQFNLCGSNLLNVWLLQRFNGKCYQDGLRIVYVGPFRLPTNTRIASNYPQRTMLYFCLIHPDLAINQMHVVLQSHLKRFR